MWGAGGGHAIRTSPILLIVIDHAISIPLAIVGTVRINGPSRGRWWQRRGRVTWGHRANAASHETRWRRLMPVSWIAWGPIATMVWGRRRVLLFSIMPGAALGNLDMDAFS